MKERIAHPEMLKKLATKIITKQLKACELLRHNYQQKRNTKNCPLCTVAVPCYKCPWYYIAGISMHKGSPCCDYFESANIADIRGFPAEHKRQANARVKHLTYWIKVLNIELERRQQHG